MGSGDGRVVEDDQQSARGMAGRGKEMGGGGVAQADGKLAEEGGNRRGLGDVELFFGEAGCGAELASVLDAEFHGSGQ